MVARFFHVAFFAALLALPMAACGDDSVSSSDGQGAISVSPAPAGVSGGSEEGSSQGYAGEGTELPPPVVTGPEEPSSMTCPYQELVGKTLQDANLPKKTGRNLRILYPDSPATMDFSPDRVNIILERGTDKIIAVRCG